MQNTRIVEATTVNQIAQMKSLLQAYAAERGDAVNVTSTIGNDLAQFPGRYAPPRGAMLIALHDGAPIGCVGIVPINDTMCEIKRLYVLTPFRRLKMGRALMDSALRIARERGYVRAAMSMFDDNHNAIALYRSMGFVTIPPFKPMQVSNIIFMGRDLSTL